MRRLEALIQMHQQEVNRLQAGVKAASVVVSISSLIEYLDQDIKTMKVLIQEHINQHPHLQTQRELLTSIPGIAALTAAKLLAEIPNLASYQSARQVAAYAGLTPSQHVSGSSVRGKTRLCKTGNAKVRKALYMPAVVALQCNPIIRSFYERLRQRGKNSLALMGALMRKLLHIAYGVLKTGKPFDPNYAGTT